VNLKTLGLLILIILFASSSLFAQSELTINEAIELALQNNESYLKAEKDLEKAKNRVTEVKASAFPQLNAGLNVIHNWELPSFIIDFNGQQQEFPMGTVNSFRADLTVTQPIYNGGRVFTAWGIAKMYKKFSSRQLEMKKRSLKLNVIRSFWLAVMADELLRVTRQSVELAEDGLDVVEKMAAQGIVSDYDVLMAKVRAANIKPGFIEAEANSKISHKALNNLIGLPENENNKLIFSMDSVLYLMPDIDIDSAKTACIEKRPEIDMMRLQTKMLKKAVSVAKAGYRPSINFLTTLQYQAQYDNNRWPGSDDWRRSSFSGLMISVPLFDSWRTPSKVKQAKLELAQSKLTEKEYEENIKLEIEQSWWNYQKARESLAAGGQAVEMSKRGLEIARVRYENGVGTQLEYFESEVALSIAEINRIKAFYNLATGYAALQKALGEDNLLK